MVETVIIVLLILIFLALCDVCLKLTQIRNVSYQSRDYLRLMSKRR